MTTKKGTLFVYSGPSGVGKGTLLAPLMGGDKLQFSISMTTRVPRPGEVDGREYFFVDKKHFEQAIEEHGFLEYTEYNGNFYGTPRHAVEELLMQGIDVVLEIEVQGAMNVRRVFPEAVLIFILPPSYETLRQRLSGRGTEEPQVVERRLEAAKNELRLASEYDYMIINDDVRAARAQLQAVFTAAKNEKRFMLNLIEKVCVFI